MIKHIAIWYLKKIEAQVIININFLKETSVTGTKNKDFQIHNCDGERLNVYKTIKRKGG